MVGQQILDLFILVRVQVPQQFEKNKAYCICFIFFKLLFGLELNKGGRGNWVFPRVGNYSKPRVLKEERSDDWF